MLLPLRVLVKGASTVHAVGDPDYPRHVLAYPRALEAALYAAGRPALVRSPAVSSELTGTALRVWEREVMAWSPDVVVLNYGVYESIHFLLPRWLERHANSLRRRPGRLRETYRKRVLRPVWVALAQLQSRLDRALPPTLRHRERAVVRDLARVVERARSVGRPLVLVLDVLPPNAHGANWFPGMAARVAAMNGALARFVESTGDPDVRLVRLGPIAGSTAGDPVPDGFHFSPALHAALGATLAATIGEWAEDQPHLQTPPQPQ
jgi:lysophospholipase L1-like esterase